MKRIIGAAIVLVSLGAASLAYAQTTSEPETIYGCANPSSGEIKKMFVNELPNCKSNETLYAWSAGQDAPPPVASGASVAYLPPLGSLTSTFWSTNPEDASCAFQEWTDAYRCGLRPSAEVDSRLGAGFRIDVADYPNGTIARLRFTGAIDTANTEFCLRLRTVGGSSLEASENCVISGASPISTQIGEDPVMPYVAQSAQFQLPAGDYVLQAKLDGPGQQDPNQPQFDVARSQTPQVLLVVG